MIVSAYCFIIHNITVCTVYRWMSEDQMASSAIGINISLQVVMMLECWCLHEK